MNLNKTQRQMLYAFVGLVIITGLFTALTPLTVISVSHLNIDPQGYLDPNDNEWSGSFWSIEMLVDVSDQIAGFHLGNDDGTPDSTYAETVDGKTYQR